MIESIVVLCTTKEEKQRWIDLLIQEQGTNVLKSPNLPRVSCHHPPYARLSRYFAKLVRRKVIYPELMKKLLYIQYILKPDLSNVTMRKCSVTYKIFPIHNSEGSDSDTLSESHDIQESRILRKSTLMLDVKYIVENIDLSTVGIANSSSLTNFASRVDCGDRCTFETSKSLPVGTAMSHVLPNVTLAKCKSYASNLQVYSNRFCRKHLEIPYEREHPGLLMNYMKAIEFHPEISNVPNICVPIQHSMTSTQTDEFQRTYANISLRSSDSGMAESCHLNSSEVNSCYKSDTSNHTKYTDPIRMSHSESENDENKFEHQCICTSPFGSTPRDSAHSLTSYKNINACTNLKKPSMDGIDNNINDNLNNDGKHIQETVVTHPLISHVNTKGKRYTQPIPYEHQCVIKKVGRHVVRPIPPIIEEYEPTNQIYSSGLYAHWWLKKTIPISGCTGQGKLPWHGCSFYHFTL